MDQSLEVTNIKTESTDSTLIEQMEISPELQLNSVKQESDYLVQSEIKIKTEPEETENYFPIIAATSYNMCASYNMKFEMDETLIKIECEGMIDALMQDPLNVDREIKVEEHFSVDMEQGQAKIKIEPTEEEKDENLLEFDYNTESHRSAWNSQVQQLMGNDPDSKDKKYICNECNRTFRWKSHFDNHSRIHTGIKPYTCNICKKSFTQKCTLDVHMLVHSGEKPHSCNLCKKVFSRKSHLDDHKLIHSGVKSFSCDVCEKSFMQKKHLVVHKRIHTGEKPFACDACKKTFTQKSVLTQHKRTHTGEKPYSCNICTKSFVDKRNLNKHEKIHKK